MEMLEQMEQNGEIELTDLGVKLKEEIRNV
jgi:hypothetical protein